MENLVMNQNYQDGVEDNKLNSFINIDGNPYLVGESIKHVYFKQVDRSKIINEVSLDAPSHNCATITISVDDTGKGVGNRIKYNDLLDIVTAKAATLGKNLDVLRREILVQIRYQIENTSTGEVICTYTAESIIKKVEDFTIINPDDVNDNIVLTNFQDFINAGIVDLAHGTYRTSCRIMDANFFYLAVPSNKSNKTNSIDNVETSEQSDANALYHFTDDYNHIFLNYPEIENKNIKPILIPAGSVTIDKTFDVNVGHTVIFKLSIWKNDIIFVSNTSDIAKTIGVISTDPVTPVTPEPAVTSVTSDPVVPVVPTADPIIPTTPITPDVTPVTPVEPIAPVTPDVTSPVDTVPDVTATPDVVSAVDPVTTAPVVEPITPVVPDVASTTPIIDPVTPTSVTPDSTSVTPDVTSPVDSVTPVDPVTPVNSDAVISETPVSDVTATTDVVPAVDTVTPVNNDPISTDTITPSVDINNISTPDNSTVTNVAPVVPDTTDVTQPTTADVTTVINNDTNDTTPTTSTTLN